MNRNHSFVRLRKKGKYNISKNDNQDKYIKPNKNKNQDLNNINQKNTYLNNYNKINSN